VGPADPRWLRVAPDPREYVYFEARLTLSPNAAVAAWTADASGRRSWSHYGQSSFAVNRDGWVRTGVAVGPDPASRVVEAGWTCLKVATDGPAGTCAIDAARSFAFDADWTPGRNLVTPGRLELRTGEEAALAPAR